MNNALKNNYYNINRLDAEETEMSMVWRKNDNNNNMRNE